MLSPIIPAEFVPEPVEENPYLIDYYKDPKRWALAMQIDLLYRRVEAANRTRGWNLGLYDRSLWGDRIFGLAVRDMGLMEQREFATYDRVFRALVEKALLPDVIVYLRAPLDTVWARVQERNRGAEAGMTCEYLGRVWNHYETFLSGYPEGAKVVTLDWSKYRTPEDVWRIVTTTLGLDGPLGSDPVLRLSGVT